MAEDPGWHSRGQFQDAVITEFPIFIDEDGDPSNYHCSTSPPVYERCSSDVLGAEIEDESSLNEGVSRCFNCGSIYHLVSSCPTPHNTELIALSRQMYNFFKPSRVIEPMTLSAAAEFKHQRYEWVDSLQPGHVRNPLLREALGLHDDDVCSNLPWLKNMANWGYPSGWFSEQDPQEQVLQRIDGMFVETVDPGEGDLFLAIFGDDEVEMLDVSASPVRKVPRCEETEREQDTRECPAIQLDQTRRVESGRSHRWATYPPTYFSSDLLPVYNGMHLPPVQPMTSSTTFSSERHLLWERILHDADTNSTQTQRLVSQYIGKVPQHSSLSAPLPIAPPPPLPPLPPPAPTTNLEVGAHQAGMSGGESDGESDMEISDSDS